MFPITLDHETTDNTVESTTLIGSRLSCGSIAHIAKAEMAEILCGLGNNRVVEFHYDATSRLISNCYVEKNLVNKQ